MDSYVLGPVMVDIDGVELSHDDRRRLCAANMGGVILFARNFASTAQLQALVEELHALRTPSLIVAIDQEGGRVQRLRNGFTPLPAAAQIGIIYDDDAERGTAMAEASGWVMATELVEVGIDVSFTPVLDCAAVTSDVIGDRAFHYEADGVAHLGAAYMRGMHRAGMPAVGKHFPGHGGVAADSHVELPIDERAMAEIERADLVPYRRLIGAGLDAVMTAHICYEHIDPVIPTYSAYWLGEVLRGQLGFEGVIFSDDLSMHGADRDGGPVARVQAALSAGCDMVLLCNDSEAADIVLTSDALCPAPESSRRLHALIPRARQRRCTATTQSKWDRARELISALSA